MPFPTQDPLAGAGAAPADPMAAAMAPQAPQYNEKALLDYFDKLKRESFSDRWVWEREWLRDIYYTVNRQWIYWHPTRREWVDKRLQNNVPRPVTNKIAEVVQSLRSTFGSIELGVVARPVGHNPESVGTAEIVDKVAPLLHDEHKMTQIMRDSDFWFIVTGNACIQMSWDTDKRFNRVFIPSEQCQTCGTVLTPLDIQNAMGTCPGCGGQQFTKALRPDGQAEGQWASYGKGKTSALSPFEYALPPNVTRFDDIPYIIRLRWRDKSYYEANYPDIAHRLVYEQAPQDRSLQIFKSLSLINDIGTSRGSNTMGGAGSSQAEGITEYELWLKPTNDFPEGFVMRVAGDRSPSLIYATDEGIPGPLPYKDREGMPLFPFGFATFEQVGGRIYGRSAISPIIQKQDQLNQLDSLIQMIVQRVANPVWIVPEGSGLDKFTGDPGLVMKWNPLAGGGTAKPERIAGEDVPATLFHLREQYLKDIEELSGTYDVIKGNKPQGVEAFSALQLLVERSQARFTSAFASRGEMYRHWFGIALEMERQFGPQQRVMSVISPNKGYTFQHFENAQLQGNVTIRIEDGTNVPKTPLGRRAAIEHANQLGLIDPADPDQKYAVLQTLGLAELIPSIDVHVQTALKMQDEFEQWAEAPMGPAPLVVKPWHDPQIHLSERIKWINTDSVQELMKIEPLIEEIITVHLQELQMTVADMQAQQAAAEAAASGGGPPGDGPPKKDPEGGVGAGRSMRNANRNAGSPTLNQNGGG